MHELKQTGFMHNRMRMVTAQFLTKELFIDWTWGENYFKNLLIDYDAASMCMDGNGQHLLVQMPCHTLECLIRFVKVSGLIKRFIH